MIPLGNPESENATVELNPFNALTVTVMLASPPRSIATLVLERVRVKSGENGEEVPPPEFPPPHAASVSEIQNRIGRRIHRTKAGAANR